LKTETVYKHGVKEGLQKEYAEDGVTVKKQTLFVNDKAVKA
jgi:antitoxin component YwqK of YwqJK toxin-antitoxin module